MSYVCTKELNMKKFTKLSFIFLAVALSGCFHEDTIYDISLSKWEQMSEQQKQAAIREYKIRYEPRTYGVRNSIWNKMTDEQQIHAMKKYKLQKEIEAAEESIASARIQASAAKTVALNSSLSKYD